MQAAADLSIRYITDRHLPDKAIDLIDEASSRVRLRHSSAPPELRIAQKELDRITKEKDAAINAQEYEQAATLREAEATSRETVDKLRSRVAVDGVRRDAQGRRGGDRAGRRDVDRHPGDPHRPGGVRAAAQDGGGPPPADDRPGGGDRDRLPRRPPRPRRPQGSQAPDRLVHLPRPHGRREDRARQGARRVHVRLRGHAHQDRHERVHGAPQREPPRRGAARLRRVRRGRPADRGRPAQELRGDPARRDREGPRRGVQHPAPDPGGRAPHRRQGPPRRLPEHDHHHDLEPRGREDPDQLVPRLPPAGRHGRDARRGLATT